MQYPCHINTMNQHKENGKRENYTILIQLEKYTEYWKNQLVKNTLFNIDKRKKII